MIGELMQAMVERAPGKVVKLQRQGTDQIEEHAKDAARRALEEIELQNVPHDYPNLHRMVSEIAFQNALEEVLSD